MAGNNYELTQAGRARLVALMGVETSRTYRARVTEVEAANREHRSWSMTGQAAEDASTRGQGTETLRRTALGQPTMETHGQRSSPLAAHDQRRGCGGHREMPTPTAQR